VETIASRLEKVRTPHGFDYLRIGLALCVLLFHSIELTDLAAAKQWARHSPWAPLKFVILPMFFALSGFLVAGSLERSRTIAGFLTLRAVRLVPALTMEVLLSALILGPLVTELALREYFSSPLFWHYFLNIIGEPQYRLPGVFTHHPHPLVNQQLWTIPYELGCYGSLALLGFLGLTRRRRLALAALLAFMTLVWIAGLFEPTPHPKWNYTWSLTVAFFAGVVLSLFRDRVPWTRLCGALSLAATILLYILPATRAFAMLPTAYLTVWLGLFNPRPSWIAGKADYSYGVYLFAYPLQQLMWLWPPLRPVYVNAIAATLLALFFAALSWHLVERPTLRRKAFVVARVEALTAAIAARLRIPRRVTEGSGEASG
jgi:peptidoglycan/LPS O-acetylase OafA/YrhL